MDFEFSEDQELLRDSVRRFLDEQAPVTPYARAMLDDPCGASAEVWKGVADLGLPGLLIPESFGGAGLSMLEMGIVLEEMGRQVHPGPFASTALAAPSLLLAAGNDTDHGKWLPGLASGERVATVALYEPGRRHDWDAPATRADRAGGGWTLTGEKTGVLDGAASDLLLVAAEAEGELRIFAVENGGEGVDLRSVETIDGTRKRADIEFTAASAQPIGTGDASAALARTLDRMVVGVCADGVGAAQRAMEMSIAYANERVQFDRPIGSFQAIQHLLADMLQDLELGRAAAYYALWALEFADAREGHRAASLCKAFVSRAFPQIGAQAIQVFGGVGFTWEYDIHLYFKRLLSLESEFGGESEHLEELAKLVLDR